MINSKTIYAKIHICLLHELLFAFIRFFLSLWSPWLWTDSELMCQKMSQEIFRAIFLIGSTWKKKSHNFWKYYIFITFAIALYYWINLDRIIMLQNGDDVQPKLIYHRLVQKCIISHWISLLAQLRKWIKTLQFRVAFMAKLGAVFFPLDAVFFSPLGAFSNEFLYTKLNVKCWWKKNILKHICYLSICNVCRIVDAKVYCVMYSRPFWRI